MLSRPIILFILLLILLLITSTQAETVLKVGLKESPPFTYKNEQGQWEGVTVSLWEKITDHLNLEYKYEEKDLQGLLEGVEKGSFDVVIGALTITSAREKRFDFSHSFYTTGLGVVTRKGDGGKIWTTIVQLVKRGMAKLLGLVLIILISISGLVWFFEWLYVQTRPQEMERARDRWGETLWWSLVIMLGYDDRHPVSLGGRIVALIWMVASLFIVSGVTAVITSALTVNELQSNIEEPKELRSTRVGTVPNSSSAEYFDRESIKYYPIQNIHTGLKAVVAEEIDAFVYDRPLLLYFVAQNYQTSLEVLGFSFEAQNYGLAFPNESPYLEPVNQSLLNVIYEPQWQEVLNHYIGN